MKAPAGCFRNASERRQWSTWHRCGQCRLDQTAVPTATGSLCNSFVIPGRIEDANPKSETAARFRVQLRVSRNDASDETHMNETDVVIIGAGHNGLTCAAYLGCRGPAREGRRAAQGRGRRGGDGRIRTRIPQFGRRLHREPAQPENHFRPETRRTWPQDRRAPRAEFPARAGRPLSAHRRRPHAGISRQAQPARRRTARWLQPRN